LRVLLQRVSKASVSVESRTIGEISQGFVVFLGISKDDSDKDIRHIVEKVTNLRVFVDSEGKFNLSALDIKADLLIISQFTLYADSSKGRRPSFLQAALPEKAEKMFNQTVDLFKETGLNIQTGQFQANMMVSISNDGPFTVMLDSEDRKDKKKV
jgi:D-tyrosyl-tRNA(Tyr) deacylase